MDASGYARGAQQKVSADASMIASAKSFGMSLADTDAALNRLPAGMARLSRTWIEGYSEAEKFQRTLLQIDKAMGEGMGADRAVTMVNALEQAYGRTASAAELARQKLVAVAGAVNTAHSQASSQDFYSALGGVGSGGGKSAEASARFMEEALRAQEQDAAAAAASFGTLEASVASLRSEIDPFSAAQRRLNEDLSDYRNLAASGIISTNELAKAQEMARSRFVATADAIEKSAQKNQTLSTSQMAAQAEFNKLLGVTNGGRGSNSVSVSGMQEALAEMDRMRGAANSLREIIDPLTMATNRYNAELAEYKAMADANVITTEEMAKAQGMADVKFAQISDNIKRAGNNVRLSRFEVANMSYQLNDIAVMLSSGQSPFITMMQQGGQLAQILSPHGLGGGLKALGSGIYKFLTDPVNLAVLGFAALAGAAAWAYRQIKDGGVSAEELLKKQKTLLADLKSGYEAYGRVVADSKSHDMSVIEFQVRFNIEESKKKITKGLQDLQKLVPDVSPIRSEGMFGVLMAETPIANKEARKLIEEMADAAKNGAGDINTLRSSIIALNEVSPETKTKFLEMTNSIEEFQAQANAASLALDPLASKLAKLYSNPRKLLGESPNNADVYSFLPDYRSKDKKLQDSYSDFLKTAGGDTALISEANRVVAETQAAWNTEMQKTVELGKIDLQNIYARSPAQKAHIAAERERINLLNTETSETERAIRVASAYSQTYAQASYAIAEANRQRAVAANDNIKKQQIEVTLVGASAYQRSLETSNLQTYLDLQKQAADNGLSFDKAQYELLKKKNEEAAHFIELQTAQKLTYDLENQRRYLDMTPSQADIAQKMDGSGLSKTSEFYDQIRSQMQDIQSYQRTAVFGARSAFNEIMDSATNSAQITKDIIKDIYSQGESIFTNFVTTGKLSVSSLIETLTADLAKFAYSSGFRALMGMGTDGSGGFSFSNLISGLFSGSTFSATGNGFYANGAAFGSGSELFGQGGSFTNGIFSRPTAFPMAHGKVGVMGERDTEAVMPLARGSDGKLGVHVSGQQASSAPVSIDAKTNVIIYGNTDARQLKAILDAREANMKKALPGWIRDAQKRGKI